jgi:hypothetical protein
VKDEPVDLSVPALPTASLARGLEVRIDLRLAGLAAALTAGSTPAESEHALVGSSRSYLVPHQEHPSVRWLQQAVQRAWLLGVAMQTVQLAPVPPFSPPAVSEIPAFVLRDFAEPTAAQIGQQLAAFWRDAELAVLLGLQSALWQEVIDDIVSVLRPTDIVGFEEVFWGIFPYRPVVVPLANLVPTWVNGVGVANQRETYAVCCLKSSEPFHAQPLRILDLAQHEASHPVLETILQEHPAVPAACAFVEAAHPPTGRFVEIYDTPASRWAETLVRASTWFFLQELGRGAEAREHIQRQIDQGARMLGVFISALTPWWQDRRAGRAGGLDQVLDQLPIWLQQVG